MNAGLVGAPLVTREFLSADFTPAVDQSTILSKTRRRRAVAMERGETLSFLTASSRELLCKFAQFFDGRPSVMLAKLSATIARWASFR